MVLCPAPPIPESWMSVIPGMDGYMVCEELKEHDSTKNILSAKASLDDKVKAMGLGIDDYMIKPFECQGTGSKNKNEIEN